MSIVGMGTDICSIARIREYQTRYAHYFIHKILTPAERQIAATIRDPCPFIAGRFAVKEATLKALGLGGHTGFKFQEMEVLPDALGKPELTFLHRLKAYAAQQCVSKIWTSLSHEKAFAIAVVLLTQ